MKKKEKLRMESSDFRGRLDLRFESFEQGGGVGVGEQLCFLSCPTEHGNHGQRAKTGDARYQIKESWFGFFSLKITANSVL